MFYETLNVNVEVVTVVAMKTCFMERDDMLSGRCFRQTCSSVFRAEEYVSIAE